MRLKHFIVVIAAALSLIFMPVAANAQSSSLSCNANGTVGSGQFYDASATTGACQYQGIQHIFSQVFCNFVTVVNSVMGQVYCGIQYIVTPILAILLSLYMAVFGAQILMGTAQLNARDILLRLIKIAAVWTLATESTWGITLIFNFFFGAATEGAMWVINGIHASDPTTMPVTDANGNYLPMEAYLDQVFYSFVQLFTGANEKLLGFFAVLLVFFPSLFAMVASWVTMTIGTLGRTFLDSALCVAAFAFLTAISPIFLCFMLFKSTAYLFDEWLKHLISYAAQFIVVFAIIALWIAAMSVFSGFFTVLTDIIFPYQNVILDNVFNPDDTYGICKYVTSYSVPGNPGQACVTGLPCMPSLQCDGSGVVIPPSQLLFKEDFIYFMTYNLIALLIVAYTFGAMAKNAPQFAASIASGGSVAPLTTGFGASGFGLMGGKDEAPQTFARRSAGGRKSSINDFIQNAAKMLTKRDTPG